MLFEQLRNGKVNQMLQEFDKSTKVIFPKENDPLPPAPAPSDPKK